MGGAEEPEMGADDLGLGDEESPEMGDEGPELPEEPEEEPASNIGRSTR